MIRFLFVENCNNSHIYCISRFNQCFGVFGVLDRLHGTDTKFRQTKQYERHTLLTSLTPLNESIPDTTKKGLWGPVAPYPLTSGPRLAKLGISSQSILNEYYI